MEYAISNRSEDRMIEGVVRFPPEFAARYRARAIGKTARCAVLWMNFSPATRSVSR